MRAFVPNLRRWGKKKTAASLAAALAVLAPVSAAAQWLRVDARADLQRSAARIERMDARPLTAALQAAGLSLPAQVHVTLVAEDEPLARRTPRWFVGLATGAREIVIFPERISAYPYDSLETVLRHEVVHLALNARSGGGAIPRWFHEGTAISVESGWRTTDRLRLLMTTLSSPAVEDVTRLFASPSEPETAQAYLLAGALMEDLRARHGATLPGRIAARIAGDAPFGRAFEAETGETPNQAAVHAWRNYRRWTSWAPSLASPSSTWLLILAVAFVAFFVQLWRRARRRRAWDDEDEDQFPSS